ncbi:hypothetical protein [Kribbella sp. CA-247076]|uniref:hypothetical protein n=1 Tax=Kribbella sp. CA-247076 TaxID=3239941 RepID=UPI003D8DD66C
MRTTVATVRLGEKYRVDFTDTQRSLLRSVGLFVQDRPDASDSVVRFGVGQAVASNIMEKALAEDALLAIEELHVIYSVLVGAALMMQSEEEFYLRLGFFREQAIEVANALAASLSPVA